DIHIVSKLRIGGDIHIVSKLRIGGIEVSRSNTALFLGRLPSARGIVEPGSKRGKNLGFPTINLRNLKEQQLPKNGVYAGYARYDSHRQKAMIYVGAKPTFDETERMIEAHLLDLPEQRENLYGRQAEILFLRRIRNEMKFENTEKLREQLEKDRRNILDILREDHG
ncbi:riboflavin kinase / FMN adenylyltransferase, partial [Candidatus Hakubella thermalkaliphila]